MSKTISTFKSELQRKLRGTSLARVADFNSTVGEAAGNLLAEIDPIETVRIAQLSGAVHDDVYDYTAPSDLKGSKIVDIRPQVNRNLSDNPSQRGMQDFDLRKTIADDVFSIYWDDGTKWIRYSKDVNSRQKVIDGMASLTANGSWSAGDDATSLVKDTVRSISGGASLKFNLSGATTAGYIENSTLTAVDLTSHDEQSSLFLWVYIPDSSIITNYILRWGNDSSNYWSQTVTQQAFGSFQNGWNFLKFDWNGATETGTVAPATIDYVRITVTYDGTADTDLRVDQLFSSIGEETETVYYSKYLFRNTSGTWLEAPTADTDVINLDTDSYNILLYEAARIVTQEVGGEDSRSDYQYHTAMLYGDGNMPGLYKLYKRSNLSQSEKFQSVYYRV
jgi:hypothetical protein